MPEDKTIWAVGGGKGGIGKSVTTANIGCALAKKGSSVILVDADLGGANLHTYFGIKFPPRTLEDFLKGKIADLSEAAVETEVPGLRIIAGGGEFLSIADPASSQKQKLIDSIKKLDADRIIVDLGAGSSCNVLDFFALSSKGIIILAPEPAAIQNAYVFLKSFVYRILTLSFAGNSDIAVLVREAAEGRAGIRTFSDLCENMASADKKAASDALCIVKSYVPKIVLNMALSKDDIRVVEAFSAAASAFLGMNTSFAGLIHSSAAVKGAARRMRPYYLDQNANDARIEVDAVVENLLKDDRKAQQRKEATATQAPKASKIFGYNENIRHQGTVFHIQTEAQGGSVNIVETVIYNGGRIFFSKRTDLNDVYGAEAGKRLSDYAEKQHRAAIAAIKLNKITFKG